MTKWEWIIPFKGRHRSGAYNQNFLCRHENVYVMDNHRAALWCWHNEINLTAPHSIIHIDRHADALSSRLEEWREVLPDFGAGIETYLNSTYDLGGIDAPVISWDNYLSIHLDRSKNAVKELKITTPYEGDKPKHPNVQGISTYDLLENIRYILENGSVPWIVNIDLDYFFCENPFSSNDDERKDYIQMISDTYIECMFDVIAEALTNKRIGVLTVCLTPTEYTSGWKETEEMATKALARLGLDFKLIV